MLLEFKKVNAQTSRAATTYSYEENIGRDLFDYRNTETLGDVFQGTTNFLFFLAFALSIVFIAVSGLKFLMASGDKTKLETAKNSLIYSIIAMVIIIFLSTLVTFIGQLFGTGARQITQFDPLPTTTP